MKEIFAQRLKNARIMAGLSMDALASKIGLSKEAIRKYEHSEAQPNSSNLIKLAKALNVNVDYFFRAFNVELGNVEFRKKAKLGKTKAAQIKQRIKDNLERYLELEDILALQSELKNPVSHMVVQSADDAELAAEVARKEWKLGLNPIYSITETLEENHIKVIAVDEPEEFDGLSALIEGRIPVIVINKNFPVERKRFTLLHELGHLLLTISGDTEKKVVEKYCNRFAGAFLIPQESMVAELGRQRINISVNEAIEIQREWGISISALIYRAKDLHIISESKATHFYRKYRSNKSFQNHIDQSRFPDTEHSNRFNQLLGRALAQELISLSKASALSNTPVNKIKSELTFI